MYKKTCPACKGDSYSAACSGQWICPYCQADMTNVEPQPAGRCLGNEKVKENGKVVNLNDYIVSNKKKSLLC